MIGTGSEELGLTRFEEAKYNENRGQSATTPGEPLPGP